MYGTLDFSLRMNKGQITLEAYRVVLREPAFRALTVITAKAKLEVSSQRPAKDRPLKLSGAERKEPSFEKVKYEDLSVSVILPSAAIVVRGSRTSSSARTALLRRRRIAIACFIRSQVKHPNSREVAFADQGSCAVCQEVLSKGHSAILVATLVCAFQRGADVPPASSGSAALYLEATAV